MSKDPAILFYTGDFLNGCTDLTFEERGQYITLLCLQHQKGHLSEKTIRLSLGYGSVISKDVLSKFKIDENGNYFNERMEQEVEKRQHFLDSRYFNGKKGGRPKKPNSKPNKKPNSKPKQNLSDNENINEIKELYKGVEIFFDEDCRPKTEKSLQDWYNTLDKLIRVDGYTPEHIHDVIKRARMDDFWRQNFLSILKLRKKNKDGISYFTVFEKKLNNGTKKDTGADPWELAKLTAAKLGIK